MVTFETEQGVSCWRCKGTRWRFEFERYGAAICRDCLYSEGPLLIKDRKTLPAPTTAEDALKLHVAFLADWADEETES
jgi:hypothetical protein